MKTLDEYNVKIFTDNVEDSALDQLRQLMSISVFKDCKVRVMPDVHAGAGCVIGFTADLGERVIPNIVGVDIGCAMLVTKIDDSIVDKLGYLDNILSNGNNRIPSGMNIRVDPNYLVNMGHGDVYSKAKELVNNLKCYRDLTEPKRIYKSIGSLGGGNHFIEVNVGSDGSKYLVIHTGSRNLGKQVADIYQKLAFKNMNGWDKLMEEQNRIIAEYKAAGRRTELQEVITKLHHDWKCNEKIDVPRELCYLEGQSRLNYLHDMSICQEWSKLNRRLIRDLILAELNVEMIDEFETMHNYIDLNTNMIRKGAVSAKLGERLLIPMNMRDGSLICIGRGSDDWNQSAPHGAGRLFSRAEAFRTLSMDDYKKSMEGIFTTSVCESTLDEAPMVYKPMQEIIDNIGDTVKIIDIIKPIYNFKAKETKFNFNN